MSGRVEKLRKLRAQQETIKKVQAWAADLSTDFLVIERTNPKLEFVATALEHFLEKVEDEDVDLEHQIGELLGADGDKKKE